jgi:hypothetical protein
MAAPANANKLIKEDFIFKKSPKGFGVHFWQKRWCVLTGTLFAYFKDKTAKEPQGTWWRAVRGVGCLDADVVRSVGPSVGQAL